MKIKIRESDRLYSLWLCRERKRCERCGGLTGLQCSHFYGRANEAVRFDPLNTDCLCYGCHQYFTSNPAEYVAWKKKKLGEKNFKQLTLNANSYKKRDDKLELLWLKKELMIEEKEKPRKQCADHKLKFCTLCFPVKKKKKKEPSEE